MDNSVKKCINEILEICLEIGLFFEIAAHVNHVHVRNKKGTFSYYSYYKGELIDYEDQFTLALQALLIKIKEYKEQ